MILLNISLCALGFLLGFVLGFIFSTYKSAQFAAFQQDTIEELSIDKKDLQSLIAKKRIKKPTRKAKKKEK
jgi:hypothetical protein